MNGCEIFSGCLKAVISEQTVLTAQFGHLVGKLEANEPSGGRTTAKESVPPSSPHDACRNFSSDVESSIDRRYGGIRCAPLRKNLPPSLTVNIEEMLNCLNFLQNTTANNITGILQKLN